MNKKPLYLSLVFTLTLALLAVTAPLAFAGDGDDTGMQEMDQKQDMQQEQDMQQMHEQMMQRHQQMLDEMKQSQAKLDSLVEQMQSAQGDAKVDAVAAVLQELVAQHQKNMAQRLEMMEGMGGMMGHGMSGMHHGGEKMMNGHGGHCSGHCDGKAKCADCPMKDGMKGDCPMHEKCENCPMHKEMMDKDTMEKGEGMSSDGR